MAHIADMAHYHKISKLAKSSFQEGDTEELVLIPREDPSTPKLN